MTENGAKCERIHEDYLVEKHLRNKDSDRSMEGVVNIPLGNLASGSKEGTSSQPSSFVQQCSPRETEKCYNKKNESTTGAEFSKKTSERMVVASRLAAFFPGFRHTKDHLKEKGESIHNKIHVESSEIPRKTKEEDARNFKSMTIDRMGKMLKLKSSNFDRNELEFVSKEEGETRRVSYPCEKPSRKEKSNSLGRMLKLMDIDVGPRRIFGQSKSESANYFPKANISNDQEEKPSKVSDDRIRRAFSKMLSQIRGRAGNADTSAEPNFRATEGKSKVSLPPRTTLATRIIGKLSTSPSSLSPTKNTTSLSLNSASSPAENSEHPV